MMYLKETQQNKHAFANLDEHKEMCNLFLQADLP